MPKVVRVYNDGRRESSGEGEVSEEQQEAMARMLVEMLYPEDSTDSKKGA